MKMRRVFNIGATGHRGGVVLAMQSAVRASFGCGPRYSHWWPLLETPGWQAARSC